MNKSVADSTLNALWRKAALAAWGYRDPLSNHCDPTGETLQCHHIIKRRNFVTRWDWKNGVPLTVESHQWAHTGAGHAKLWSLLDSEYLEEMEKWLKPDYLRHIGLSENEFRIQLRDRLKAVIDG